MNGGESEKIFTDFNIREMVKDDINEVFQIFASHDLYESAQNVEAFLEADPDGSYVAVRNNKGISKGGLIYGISQSVIEMIESF
jgi:hypothetical protein